MIRTISRFALVALGLLACCKTESPAPAVRATADSFSWRADHHMHIASADLCARIDECLEVNTPVALYAADAVRALDSAHIARGVVLSCAYLYGMKSLKLSPDSITRWVRTENEFTATEIARDSARLVGFLSVDPLQSSAIDEISHWRGSTRLVGLKIHFVASEVNVRRAEHRAKVSNVLRQAAAQGLPMVIHIAGRSFDSSDARLFIDSILPATSPSVVQIAHAAGGWPLVGTNHQDVLRVFADHIVQKDPVTSRLLFDLSYFPSPEQDDTTIAAMMVEIRRIGIDRFVFGSDFDVLMPTAQVARMERLGLSPGDMKVLRSTCAPWAC